MPFWLALLAGATGERASRQVAVGAGEAPQQHEHADGEREHHPGGHAARGSGRRPPILVVEEPGVAGHVVKTRSSTRRSVTTLASGRKRPCSKSFCTSSSTWPWPLRFFSTVMTDQRRNRLALPRS